MAARKKDLSGDLLALGDLLSDGDALLRARLELVSRDPKRYVHEHARELGQRGVTKPIPRLPLIALLDGLDEAKRVALIDWKSPAEDVEHGLKGIRPRMPFDWKWTKAFDEDDLDDISTERVLRAAAAHAPPEKALINLDTTSDQFAIVVVDARHTRRIVGAMRSLGHPAAVITPKALGAPKPAKKSAGKSAARGTPLAAWPDCSTDPFGTWRFFTNRETLRSTFTTKYGTAFDVMEGPSWSTDGKRDKRTFGDPALCTAAYVAFYRELKQGGWLQLTAEEHAKEVRSNAAAKKKGTLRKER